MGIGDMRIRGYGDRGHWGIGGHGENMGTWGG